MSILSNFNETTLICSTCIHNGECEGTVCYGYENERKAVRKMTNQDAIKLIDHLKEEIVDLSDNEIQAFDLAINALEERPQGEWTIGYTAKQKKVAVCNLCNCISFQGKTNFCHNCGAQMKGSTE